MGVEAAVVPEDPRGRAPGALRKRTMPERKRDLMPRRETSRRRRRRVGTFALLVAAASLSVALAATFDPAARSDGTAPMSDDARAGFEALPAASRVWEVEGKITAVDAAARRLTVNGFTFILPDPVYPSGPNSGRDIDLGDPKEASGDAITWEQLTNPGLPSAVGFTAIAQGNIVQDAANPNLVRFVAFHVFVEETENVIFGIAGSNDPPGELYVNGLRVVASTDPRFAPFNSFVDATGGAITLADVPEGVLVSAEGAFDPVTGRFVARALEADFIKPGVGTDNIGITRAEGRSRDAELRVEGLGSDRAQTVSLYRTAADRAAGINAIATNVPIDDLDGAWTFRAKGLPGGAPSTVYARSTGGGVAEAQVRFT